MLRLRVTGRGSERTFLDLLNAQHIVQGVTHERGGIFHQAQRFQVTTIQAVAVLQDLDADGQRVQRAAQLVEDVLQEVSAGLVDASEVFLRQRATSALQQVQVDILHTFTHSPAPSRQRINIAAACTRKTFLLLQLPSLYSL